MKSKLNYIISLKLTLIDAKNSSTKKEKKSNRDIFKAFEFNLHIAVLWKAVEFEFWNHLDLLWKSMGKVKCNLKLNPSWNKLKMKFAFLSLVNNCYHLACDDIYLTHMHPVVLLFFYWGIWETWWRGKVISAASAMRNQ